MRSRRVAGQRRQSSQLPFQQPIQLRNRHGAAEPGERAVFGDRFCGTEKARPGGPCERATDALATSPGVCRPLEYLAPSREGHAHGDVADLFGRHVENVAVEDHEIGEPARRQHALPCFIE